MRPLNSKRNLTTSITTRSPKPMVHNLMVTPITPDQSPLNAEKEDLAITDLVRGS